MSFSKRFFGQSRGLIPTMEELAAQDEAQKQKTDEEQAALVDAAATAAVQDAGEVTETPAADAAPATEPAAPAVDGDAAALDTPAATETGEVQAAAAEVDKAAEAALAAADSAAAAVEATPEAEAAAPAVDTPVDTPAAEVTEPAVAPEVTDTPAVAATDAETPVAGTPAEVTDELPVVEVPEIEAAPAVAEAAPEPEAEVHLPPTEEPATTPVTDEAPATDAPADAVQATDAAAVDVPAVTDAPAAEPEVAADLGEQEFGQAEEISDEIDTDLDTVDSSLNSADTLNSLADDLEAQAQNGGASPETIRVVEIAVEGIATDLLKRRPAGRITPALETFKNGPRARLASTNQAFEAVSEWFATAVAAIKKLISSVIEALSQMADRFLAGFGKLRAQLVQLKERAKKLPSDAANKTIKIKASVAKALSLGGQFSKEAFLKGLAIADRFLKNMLGLFITNKKTVESTNIEKAVTAAEDNQTAPNIGPISAFIRKLGKKAEEKEEGVVTVQYLEPLPGGGVANIDGPSGTEIDGQQYRVASSVSVNITNVATESEEADVEIKNITLNDIAQAISSGLEVLNSAEQLREAAAQAKQTEKALSDRFSRIRPEQGAGDEGVFRRNFNKVQMFVQRAASGIARGFNVVLRWAAYFLGNVIQLIGFVIAGTSALAAGVPLAGVAAGTAIAKGGRAVANAGA